ncbi:MAG: hypothetical protein OEX81_01555 [Candidatus Pacebacteria bacterium]|nr:hypothetical protein [Candidatus Paceibacterota bacterium]
MLKKLISQFLLLFIFSTFFLSTQAKPVVAQADLLNAKLEVLNDSTDSADATPAASLASPSAEVVEKIKEKTDEDITQPTEKQKSKLATYLEETPVGPLGWNNFIQHAIRNAITEGVTPNILVLVLLFH